MSNNDIQNYLPHRYPFLLIDKIIDFKKHDYLIAQKNVSNNEPFFQGHFPDYPVFPGVLILEAMAQATALLDFKSNERKKGPPTLLVTMPMGSSAGDTIVREMRSAANKSVAPNSMLPRITRRLSAPNNMRHRWGMTSPTKPIIPVRDTLVPTMMHTKKMINSLSCSTLTPNRCASASPSNKALMARPRGSAMSAGPKANTRT